MGIFNWLRQCISGPGGTLGPDELARRLSRSEAEIRAVEIAYHAFEIPKRTGGFRQILAPAPPLKALQRCILRRLLPRLKCHPCVTGFERGHSVVTNALPHVGRAVVVRMDVRDFFDSTASKRIQGYFRTIGWSPAAAELLTQICTFRGALPQGAPTSPRLSNLVNYRLDARLAAMAGKLGAGYSRYADDLTFSFAADNAAATHMLIRAVKATLRDEGYQLHTRKKLHIRRRHDRQIVTGLVVNERVALPRSTRRWLRAVEHHLRTGRAATLTSPQIAGWRAYQHMVLIQGAERADSGKNSSES